MSGIQSGLLESRVHAVSDVFERALGVAIDPDGDFFLLGGHSLLVIEAIADLRERYGLQVPAKQFLADASVRAVAAACTVAGSGR
ncbi:MULTISPECIES: acyl carrier protein [unclassified Nonomuraea]|uniref:acyl carrier protein n=1 Tax=unclassified Nonomuraea TaxID=2593643 RepID=UPI0035BEBCA3